MRDKKVLFLVQAAAIAAIYVVLTVAFAPLSFGEVQVRFAEGLTVLPYFTPAAIPGLFAGCLIGNFFGGSLNKLAGGVGQVTVTTTSEAFRAYFNGLVEKLDAVTGSLNLGTLLFSYGFLTYVAIIMAVLLWYFLSKTRAGLSLRAVGENTGTADAAGINVTKYKYLATCIGGGISGLGGCYYVMVYIRGTWENQGTIEALGWLAVALVIFATWKPLRNIWGSYLFGALYWAYFYIPGLTRSSQEIFKMIPYLVTLFVLITVSLRKKKEDQPPASLGIPYFREER